MPDDVKVAADDVASIPGYVEDIKSRMAALMTREPWLRISAAERVDHLPQLLDALLRDALSLAEHRQVPAAVREAGVEHGVHRREQAFREEILFDEYSMLRNETLRMLWGTHQRRDAERIIARVDRSISEATVASLRGFHQAA